MTVDYQVTDHGCGKFSVQVFERPSGDLIADENIVRDINGWKVTDLTAGGLSTDGPQFDTPSAAAAHFAHGCSLVPLN